MSKVRNLPLVLLILLSGTACGILEPATPDAHPEIATDWPSPPDDAHDGEDAPVTADSELPGWRDFFTDPDLESLIALSLEHNRDLRVAALNVERARALYRVQRADRVPSLDATGTVTRLGGDNAITFNQAYSVNLGVSAYELDLFGRVRNLSQAQLRDYLAREQAQRSLQLSLVAEVANAWLTLLADRELERIARAALANRQAQLELTEKRFELGAVSSLEVSQAEIQLETARADLWRYAGQVAQDVNALTLLVGTTLDEDPRGKPFDLAVSGLDPLPAGVPSELLLRRPDVRQAEFTLRAANARIGAARAAFFPSISLTGSIGTASAELSELFSGGSRVWRFVPQINLPIFQGGRLRANLDVTTADRDIALAQYEKAIQAGFRDVADALALTRTLAQQRASREALLCAARRADELSRARYEAGSDSYLVLLDAERTLYAAQQSMVTTLLAQQANRITLYKALGGGWEQP